MDKVPDPQADGCDENEAEEALAAQRLRSGEAKSVTGEMDLGLEAAARAAKTLVLIR